MNSVFPVSIGESKTIALLACSQQLLAAFEIFEKYNVVCYSFRFRKEQADTIGMRMHMISRSNNT